MTKRKKCPICEHLVDPPWYTTVEGIGIVLVAASVAPLIIMATVVMWRCMVLVLNS